MIYVVGSGPAGIAAAEALASAGCDVTILDGGIDLEPERQRAVERLRAIPPAQWQPPDLSFLFDALRTDQRGIQEKRAYGSDYPYREAATQLAVCSSGVGSFSPSFAVGGFSSVWGAAVLPYTDQDLHGWPIDARALRPHYEAVLRYMPLAGAPDRLEPRFPLSGRHGPPLPESRQIAALCRRLERQSEAMASSGLNYGLPRLAVRSGGNGCVQCGLCLQGCPYELIYSARQTLEALTKLPNVRYLPGAIVTTIEERAGAAVLRGYRRETREALTLEGDAVFLGAGVLATSAILLRSLERVEVDHVLPVSEYFLLPLLDRHSRVDVTADPMHALSQLFLEHDDPAVAPDTVHMQLYGYSDLYRRALRTMCGGASFLDPLLTRIAARMLVLQGYLHSASSSSLLVRLAESGELRVRGVQNPNARETVRKVVKTVRRHLRRAGVYAVTPMLRLGLPGEGRHVGGAFPMSSHPVPGQTDICGRPVGLDRTFVVDASVFPTVPAPTITFTVMANARRIASCYIESKKEGAEV